MLLKDVMGLKMENFNIMWVHWKIQFLGWVGGGWLFWSQKKHIGWNCLKQGGLGQFADLREGA